MSRGITLASSRDLPRDKAQTRKRIFIIFLVALCVLVFFVSLTMAAAPDHKRSCQGVFVDDGSVARLLVWELRLAASAYWRPSGDLPVLGRLHLTGSHAQ